jgi:hypothetical protein
MMDTQELKWLLLDRIVHAPYLEREDGSMVRWSTEAEEAALRRLMDAEPVRK